MRKRVLVYVCCICLLLSICRCAVPATDQDSGDSTTDQVTESIEETDPGVEDALVIKAIWQDPNNIVIVWDKNEDCQYFLWRSNSPEGEYQPLQTSSSASWRDATVTYPNTYYYKIVEQNLRNQQVRVSDPVQAVVAPEELSCVSVIMYHNFVSEEDIKNGIEFEEYSLSPQSFEEDLIWLRDNGYVTITSEELLTFLKNKEPIPQKAVILSIDDGTWGVYKHAWPLLMKYGMKADFNVIGKQIDDTWDMLHEEGGSREGEAAPYCTWEELIEMEQSGAIHICSHTYGLHVYDKEERIGMSMKADETADAFGEVVRKDYDLIVKCVEGWMGKKPETVAYPYSKRSATGDAIVLANTGYQILMAGEGARGTAGNYFVTGCDFENQLVLMSRPCRMDGTPIRVYLERIAEKDSQNGVNQPSGE